MKSPAPEQYRSGATNKEKVMNPILDLLNRLFIASPTLALEEVKHLFEQYMRDISYWRSKAEGREIELNRAEEECKDWQEHAAKLTVENKVLGSDLHELKESYAALLDRNEELRKQRKSLDRDMDGMCSMKDTADARIAELEAQVTALSKRLGNVVPPPDDSFEDIEF